MLKDYHSFLYIISYAQSNYYGWMEDCPSKFKVKADHAIIFINFSKSFINTFINKT